MAGQRRLRSPGASRRSAIASKAPIRGAASAASCHRSITAGAAAAAGAFTWSVCSLHARGRT